MKKIIYCLFVFCFLACTKTTIEKVQLYDKSVDLAALMRVGYSFSLFSHALQLTGLDSVIHDTTPHTVLVPDNNAFAKIGITTDDQLDRMDRDSLKRLVGMHILLKVTTTDDIPRAINRQYNSISGEDLWITHNSSTVRINGILITTPNIVAANGIIHVLDQPLRLPWPSVKYFLMHDTSFSLISAALDRFGLLDTLGSAGPFTVFAPTNAAMRGEGFTSDSIGRMAVGAFRPFVFSSGTIPGTRIYVQDTQDGDFAPPGGFNVVKPDYVLSSMYSVYYFVFDPMRSPYNPNWVDDGYGPTYLGPNPFTWWIPGGGGLTGIGPYIDPTGDLSAVDKHCKNGVVQGLPDILVWPDSARIH